jgi:type II secretory pathway pseudopilin PulG
MNQKGQGLVEALIALGAAVIIIAAITIAVITAVSNSDFSTEQNLATGFAQQGMEIVRQKSQLNWNSVATYSGTSIWCLPQETTDIYPQIAPSCQSTNVANQFVRLINFDQTSSICTGNNSANIRQVEVTVKWRDGKCSGGTDFCHKVVLDSCVANIYATQ